MPALTTEFRARVSEALKLAETGEVARVEAAKDSQTLKNFHPARIEYLYEMSYLRIFVGWEVFLEQAFIRYLCGYTSAVGAAAPKPTRPFHSKLAQAEAAVLGGSAYVLWHNPAKVVRRAQHFFASSPIETVVLSNAARLEHFAAVRHRITHGQTDARTKFDSATMIIAGKRYRGSRAGSFLRDVDPVHSPPVRWLHQLGHELQSLAAQIA